MQNTRWTRFIAVPLLSLGLLGGSLTAAATAGADDDDDDYDDDGYYSAFDDYYDEFDDYGPANEIYAAPDTYADPAPDLIPWSQWIGANRATAPQVDTTVQQSR